MRGAARHGMEKTPLCLLLRIVLCFEVTVLAWSKYATISFFFLPIQSFKHPMNIAVKLEASGNTLKLNCCFEWCMCCILSSCKVKTIFIGFILLEGRNVSLLYSEIVTKHL
jgi:hypothetical protein